MTDLGELYFQGLNRPVFANVGDAAFIDATGNLTFVATPPIIPPPPSQAAAILAAPQVAGRSLQASALGSLSRASAPGRMILSDPFVCGFHEDFFGQKTGAGTGKLRWKTLDSVTMRDNIQQGEVGGVRLQTGNGQPSKASLNLGPNSIVASECRFACFVGFPDVFGVGSVETRLGLWSGFDGGSDTEGAFFYASPAPPNFMTRTMTGGVVTEKDTGVGKGAAIDNFVVVKTAAGFDFYINNVLVTSHTALDNIPSGLVNLGVELEAVTTQTSVITVLAVQYLATRGGVFNNA